MSLKNPHPIWTTAQGNPHEVTKAIQQARFLSGRYRTEYLSRHWSNNPRGCCRTEDSCSDIIEDTKHILLECPAYAKEKVDFFLDEDQQHHCSKTSTWSIIQHSQLPAAVYPWLLSPTLSHHSQPEPWKGDSRYPLPFNKNMVLCKSSPAHEDIGKMEFSVAPQINQEHFALFS